VHRFLGREDVELIRIEYEPAASCRGEWLPIVGDSACAGHVDIDEAGVPLGPVAGKAAGIAKRSTDSAIPPSMSSTPPLTSLAERCNSRNASSGTCAAPRRSRIWLNVEPWRTTIGKVCGQISA
jgi:hypothetical protein